MSKGKEPNRRSTTFFINKLTRKKPVARAGTIDVASPKENDSSSSNKGSFLNKKTNSSESTAINSASSSQPSLLSSSSQSPNLSSSSVLLPSADEASQKLRDRGTFQLLNLRNRAQTGLNPITGYPHGYSLLPSNKKNIHKKPAKGKEPLSSRDNILNSIPQPEQEQLFTSPSTESSFTELVSLRSSSSGSVNSVSSDGKKPALKPEAIFAQALDSRLITPPHQPTRAHIERPVDTKITTPPSHPSQAVLDVSSIRNKRQSVHVPTIRNQFESLSTTPSTPEKPKSYAQRVGRLNPELLAKFNTPNARGL